MTTNDPADDLQKKRFMLNISRVGGLTKLVASIPNSPKPKGVFDVEGAQADLYRAVVVFLHATFEEVLRSLAKKPNKKMTFYSRSDLQKALIRAGLDSKPFELLYPPLTMMAKRRNQIVHNADLPSRSDDTIKNWDLIDHWQLIIWNLAVMAFYYQVLITTKRAHLLERTMYKRVRQAMIDHANFGRQVMVFPSLPPEWRKAAVDKWSKALTSVMDGLHIDLADFTIEVWNPEEEAWEVKPVDNWKDPL